MTEDWNCSERQKYRKPRSLSIRKRRSRGAGCRGAEARVQREDGARDKDEKKEMERKCESKHAREARARKECQAEGEMGLV